MNQIKVPSGQHVLPRFLRTVALDQPDFQERIEQIHRPLFGNDASTADKEGQRGRRDLTDLPSRLESDAPGF